MIGRRNAIEFSDSKFRLSNIESVTTLQRITPYPTGRLFWGGAAPGTSCQATIAPSLAPGRILAGALDHDLRSKDLSAFCP